MYDIHSQGKYITPYPILEFGSMSWLEGDWRVQEGEMLLKTQEDKQTLHGAWVSGGKNQPKLWRQRGKKIKHIFSVPGPLQAYACLLVLCIMNKMYQIHS